MIVLEATVVGRLSTTIPPPLPAVAWLLEIVDVLMLAVTGGRERTHAQLDRLLDENGFRPVGVTRTGGPMSIVEAVAQ